VCNVTTSSDDASLSRTIVLMAQSLKMKTVAEGVETQGQLAFLCRIKCDVAQGYYFSRPVPADVLSAILNQQVGMPPVPQCAQEQRTLLLVDDEENVLSALARVFRKDGCKILQTTSVHTAFELLAVHPVQVIISDQRMPTMSGIDFLSKVKEIHPETVRIVLSGYTELDSVLHALNSGAVYRFFTKPWDDGFLRDQLRAAFEYHWLLYGRPQHEAGSNA